MAAVAIRRRSIDGAVTELGPGTVRERVHLVDARGTVAAVSAKSNNKIKRTESNAAQEAAYRSASRNERTIRFENADVSTFEVAPGTSLAATSRHSYKGTFRGTPVVDRVFAECLAIQKAIIMDRFRCDGSAVASGWPVYWKEPTLVLLFIPSPSCLKKGWWWNASHVTVSWEDALGITGHQWRSFRHYGSNIPDTDVWGAIKRRELCWVGSQAHVVDVEGGSLPLPVATVTVPVNGDVALGGDAAPGTRNAPVLGDIDYWLVDTGCGNDLVDAGRLGDKGGYVRDAETPFTLHTANGDVEVTSEITVRVHELNEDVTAYVLQSTPDVLSVGLRCKQRGWGFHWEPYQDPYLVRPLARGEYQMIPLECIGDVPYLRVGAYAAPGVGSPRVVSTGSAGADSHDHRDRSGTATMGTSVGSGSAAADGTNVGGTFMLRHSDVPDDDCLAMPAVVVDALLAPAAGDAMQLYDDGRRDLKSEALSVAHLMTHKPKNRWCIACQKAKMQYRAHRNKGGVLDADIKKFGDSITADHLIAQNELSRGITGDRDALVIKDRATGWIAVRYPTRVRTRRMPR